MGPNALRTGLVAALIFGCKPLPVIADDVCGNGVIEDGEDCDTFSAGADTECRPPGSVEECHWDCRLNGGGARSGCPEGWGCDDNELCRPPSGGFAPAVGYTLSRIDSLLAADFDGDGRSDLLSRPQQRPLGESTLGFHYFDRNLELDMSAELPSEVYSPSVSDLDGDGRADVLFSDGRLGVALGRADRSWLPEAFSSYRLANTHVALVSVANREIEGVSGVLVLTELDAGTAFYVPDPETGKLRSKGALGGQFEDLAGAPVSGDLFEDASMDPCLEVVFALRGQSEFVVARVCERDPNQRWLWRSQLDVSRVALNPAQAIDGAPRIVDVDLDGHLDVMLGAGGRVFVARGDGTTLQPAVPYDFFNPNRSNSDAGSDSSAPSEPDPMQSEDNLLAGMPLALGDVTADGLLDFVFPKVVLASRREFTDAPILYEVLEVNSQAPWTHAEIADFNGNGALDIVVGSDKSPGIGFLNGQAGPYLVASTLPTDGAILDLSVGDFDGDAISDLAFVEAEPSPRAPARLSVAFGTYQQPLIAAAVGNVPKPEQLLSHNEGGIADLMLAARQKIDGEPHATLTWFAGSPTRTLTAPLQLSRFSIDRSVEPALALALAVGSFQSDKANQVLVLSMQASAEPARHWSYWLVEELSSGVAESRPLTGQLQQGLLPFHTHNIDVSLDVSSLSADFDRDGKSEMLLAMPSAEGGCALALDALDGSQIVHRFEQPLQLPEACSRPELLAVDADGDGWLDIAIISGTDGSKLLRVLWNDAGKFEAERSRRLSPSDHSPVAFTWLPAPDARGRFAYVTATSLELVASGAPRAFGSPERTAKLDAATSIAAGDFNADGVTDLALAAGGRLSILAAELEAP